MDTVLASHLERVDDNATVYVQLSHGMGPHYDGTHLLDIILQRLHEADAVPRGWRSRALRTAIGSIPAVWQSRVLGAATPQIRRYADASPPGANPPWELPLRDRRWFQVPNNAPGAIRLNLQGRESNGQVAQDDFDRVCGDLTRWLTEIVNVDSGEPLVQGVYRSDTLYRRHDGDRLPDLFIEWNTNAPIDRVYSPRIGMVVGHDEQWRTGDHRRHGLLFARGPGIEPGPREGRVPMVDVGPTLCAALHVDLPDVDGRPVADLVPSHAGPSSGPRGRRSSGSVSHQGPLRRAVTRLAAEHRATRQLAEHVDVRERQLDARVNHTAAGLEIADLRLRDLEREASVRTVTDWVRGAEVPESLTVSVIMPTRNRAAKLPRAIESVFAQSYPRWELVVVDDGSTDETPDVLAKYEAEPRVRTVRTDGLGVCRARNRGLAVATGEVIVYLDDDNLMTPWWCKAVVWAFTQRPDTQVLYGARIIDDIARARREGEGAMPSMQFEPYDFERLTRHNFTDINVLAHRSGLAEAHFDETLSTYGDWDVFWRLTRDAAPLELPVLACHYATDGGDRLSLHPHDARDRDALRAKFARLLAGD